MFRARTHGLCIYCMDLLVNFMVDHVPWRLWN